MLDFLDQIRPGPETYPPGDYAMWLPSADERLFGLSETRRELGRVYQALAGIETYAVAQLLQRLGAVGEDARRVALPDELASFSVSGPDDQVFALSVSREKGIRFHFHGSATPAYRTRVLAGFVAYLEALRRVVTLAGALMDEPGEDSPADWWRFMEQVLGQMEDRGEPVQAVGKIVLA